MKSFQVILKQKKLTIFALLFFVFTAIIIPQIAFAVWFNPFSWFDDAANGVANAIIYVALFVPLFITAVFAEVAGLVLKLALFIATSKISYTQSPAVNIGWPIVRDLANMVVVLGFVVIGIATTLRIQEYQAKKTLFPLIIAALLINFSLLITGIFIDASNIATNFFFSKVGVLSGATSSYVGNSFTILGNTFTDNWTAFGAKLISMTIFNFFIFFILLLYAVLILGRIVALWILVILSPLAFVCYVFPFTKNIWQMWWKNFSQWCIIGIPAGLFLYIGSQMMEGIITTPAPFYTPSSPVFSLDVLATLGEFFSFLLPGLFLIIGFLVSLQFSAMGASTIMNFANKNKGKILGGGLGALAKGSGVIGKQAGKLGNYLQGSNNVIGKGAGWMLNNTVARGANALGNYKATTQKTRSAFGRGLEAIGAIDPGTTAYTRSEELNKSQKRMTALVSEGKLDKVLEIAEGKGAGVNVKERGAAIGALLETKNFDMNNTKHVTGLTHFQNHGGDLNKYAEKNPELAEHNIAAVKNTMTKYGVNENRAKEMVRDSAYQNLGVKGLRELPVSAINVHLLANIIPSKNGKAADEYSDKQINMYKKYATPGTPEFIAQDAEQTRLRATGNTIDLEKADRIRDNIIEINSNPNFG